jgi:hypothetical protein
MQSAVIAQSSQSQGSTPVSHTPSGLPPSQESAVPVLAVDVAPVVVVVVEELDVDGESGGGSSLEHPAHMAVTSIKESPT